MTLTLCVMVLKLPSSYDNYFWSSTLCRNLIHNEFQWPLKEVSWELKNWNRILWKYFYWLAPIFVFSTKCIDPRVFKFVVLNLTGNNQWENCISLDSNLLGLSGPWNQWKLEHTIKNDFTVPFFVHLPDQR